MANPNPTGDDSAVALTIPAGNEAFLRRVISAARDGLRDELERFADQLQEPRSRLLLEETAYAGLLDALDRGQVVPEEELRTALARIGEAVDRGNEYDRVVCEHDAIHDLLDQLGEAVGK